MQQEQEPSSGIIPNPSFIDSSDRILLELYTMYASVQSEEELMAGLLKFLKDFCNPLGTIIAFSDVADGTRFRLLGESRMDAEEYQALRTFFEGLLASRGDSVSADMLECLPFLSNYKKILAKSSERQTDQLILFVVQPESHGQLGAETALTQIQQLASLFLENVRSKEIIRRNRAHLIGLHQSARGMSRLLFKIDALLQNICEEAGRTLPAKVTAVLVPTDETKVDYRVRAKAGKGGERPLIKTLFAKAFEDFTFNGQKGVVYRTKDETFFLLPVIQRGEPNSILLFYSDDADFSVPPDRLQVAEIFADWISIATDTVAMFQRAYNSEKEWEDTFDSIADPIYIIDNEYRLKKINKSMADFVMKGIKLPLDRNCYRYLFDQSNICSWCPVPRSMQNSEPATTEAALFHGGSWQIQAFPYMGNPGERIGSINVIRDITLLKRIQEQLIESEKLAAAGKLISGVAHEVRNPLFGISATARALANELGDKQDIKPFLEIITSETTRLNRLMEDLLNYSRPVQIDKNASDICEIVLEVMDHFKNAAAGKSVAVELHQSDRVPPINVDRNKIKQVLFNLIENGIQHSDQDAQIAIFLQYLTLANPPEIQLVVKDNGLGISEENLPKVFDPFFTTRPKGTGLGLSIVRKVIHDHGGRISIESHLGVGTTFRITLPVTNAHVL